MKIFELKCEAYLKNFIELKESFDVLSKYINFTIYQSKRLDLENKDKSINNYCFSNFYPTESDRIYKKDKIYKFVIRSIDRELINELEILLCKNTNNIFLKVLNVQKK